MLPFTESLSERILVLPTGTSVQEDSISKICDLIRFLIRNSGSVRELLDKTF